MNDHLCKSALNAAQALSQVSRAWDDDIVHRLEDYIRIPAKSPMFDADWVHNGFIGQGGSVPLIDMLAQGFPKAQMMVCGVCGPNSNAHGPNEFLHVPYAKKLTATVAHVISQVPR